MADSIDALKSQAQAFNDRICAVEKESKQKEEQLKRELAQALEFKRRNKFMRVGALMLEDEADNFYRARKEYNAAFGVDLRIPDIARFALIYFTENWHKMHPKQDIKIVDKNGEVFDFKPGELFND